MNFGESGARASFLSPKDPLTWPQRKNIVLDVAKALAYLHYGVNPAIYHRDIKTTIILLDADMRARIVDFGLVKQNTKGNFRLTIRVAGTHGRNPREIMERFVLVCILCAHVMVALRLTILEALKMLEGDIKVPMIQDRPIYGDGLSNA
ncbi:hypothetical protein RHGRI_014197 [Rhododendron griersonianum]|uniref:Protein kinase domain-containing protein n=1 Tax=Rhododendron griersonianum TaxID=479676 RepID=A0AAV6K8F4_9ERIC|nr:hypothetical protein RHGRI_014197 [Rhododendron griersonianum]